MAKMKTPEELAREDLMIQHLKAAVQAGYSPAIPGSSEAVRRAFPDLFATKDEQSGVETDDDLELDDHPMVSRSDGGVWVNCWSWVPNKEGE